MYEQSDERLNYVRNLILKHLKAGTECACSAVFETCRCKWLPQRKAALTRHGGRRLILKVRLAAIFVVSTSAWATEWHSNKNVLNFFCMDEWRWVIAWRLFLLKLRAKRRSRCATGETNRFVKELFCSLSLEVWGTQCICIAIFQWI